MNKFTFFGNGKNKDFYFTFPFFSCADIIVKINDNMATGYGVFCIPSSENFDFPFTGGRIHFANAPRATDRITIERELQLNRIIDYQPTAAINPTVLNQDMNYFFALLKDIRGNLENFKDIYAEFTDTETAQELKDHITAVNEKIDDIGEQIENLGDITTIYSNISELGTSLSNLTESVNSLAGTVSNHTTNIETNTSGVAALNTFKNEVLDYVIEKQEPTSANNYTWYRKYKSGWVEQGGLATSSTSGTSTINLPITMADTNYNTNITIGTTGNYWCFCAPTSTTQVSIRVTSGANSQPTEKQISWKAEGIAA